MEITDLQVLEAKIDELIALCHQLAEENRTLREQQSTFIAERTALLEKNALARSRIEAMITRLKAMEINPNE